LVFLNITTSCAPSVGTKYVVALRLKSIAKDIQSKEPCALPSILAELSMDTKPLL
jgi:hypothetical protein